MASSENIAGSKSCLLSSFLSDYLALMSWLMCGCVAKRVALPVLGIIKCSLVSAPSPKPHISTLLFVDLPYFC